jgi:nondiscriminating glutamyl-tRNA synthetase
MIKQNQVKAKNVFMPLRCAVSGKVHGPDLPSLLYIWGKEETVKRIKQTLQHLNP